MLDIELIRNQPDLVKASLKRRGGNTAIVDKMVTLDNEWREKVEAVEALRAKQKALSAERKIDEAKANKEIIKQLEEALTKLETERQKVWLSLPNLLADDVPDGKDEDENKIIRSWGEKPTFSFEPKDHMKIGEALGIIDMEKAAEVSGARFYYLKGDGALLELALLQYAMSRLTNSEWIKKVADAVGDGVSTKPFVPVVPPVMIRPDVYQKMARLNPGVDEDERYYIPSDDQYLIGSAEHTLGPLHMNETIDSADFPLRYVAFSTCFRREAGSYGKDTRGMIRVHQFDKIEMEVFSDAATSIQEQNFLVTVQETMLQELNIAYEVMAVCTGDMGDPDARQIDINSWIPSQGTYRETHTSDLMTDYQTRRLNTKIRQDKTIFYAHTNDATAIAMSRIIVAILENYQQKDGTVKVPEVLRPHFGKEIIG